MHLATAGGAGAAARTALAPLERVKVHNVLFVTCQATSKGSALATLWLPVDFAASRGCQSPAI